MVMFPEGHRVEDHPEQWLVEPVDPDAERERVALILRARAAEVIGGTRAPWPAPVVPCGTVLNREAWPSVVSRRVRALESANWRAVVTYARGTTFDAQRRPGRVLDSWAIRTRHQFDLRRATALWVGDGKLTSAGVLRFGDAPMRWTTITDFDKELANA